MRRLISKSARDFFFAGQYHHAKSFCRRRLEFEAQLQKDLVRSGARHEWMALACKPVLAVKNPGVPQAFLLPDLSRIRIRQRFHKRGKADPVAVAHMSVQFACATRA